MNNILLVIIVPIIICICVLIIGLYTFITTNNIPILWIYVSFSLCIFIGFYLIFVMLYYMKHSNNLSNKYRNM